MNESKQIHDSAFQSGFIDTLSESVQDGVKIRTCIQCGCCSSSCVAAEGTNETSRRLWRKLQMDMDSEVVSSPNIWNCTTCSLCDSRCPRGIPLSRIVIGLRERFAQREELRPSMVMTISNLRGNRNITGDPQENRQLWIENAGIDPNQKSLLFKDKAEIVYFTGCVASLFPQVYSIPQSLIKLLLNMESDFTLLEDEWCCGYPMLASGQGLESVAEFAGHNIRAIAEKGAKTVVVSCPTCYYMFKKVYPKVADMPMKFEILHYSEYLGGNVAQNSRFKFKTDEVIVTYHDPCDLGRKMKVVDKPRELLKNLPGVKLVEMRFNSEEGKCCGGGGNMEMTDPELAARIAQKRVEEAMATNAQYLLTCCQQCKRTLQNAVRKARARLKVNDLLEFVDSRYEPAAKGEER